MGSSALTRAYDLACGGGQLRKGQKLANYLWQVTPQSTTIEEKARMVEQHLFYMSDAEFDKALSE